MAHDQESKSSYFAFLIYKHKKLEDGSISDEEQISRDEVHRRLAMTFGMFAISPWHKPDEDDPDEHLHVIYKHPGNIRPSSVRKILNSVTLDVPVYNDFILTLHSPKVYSRYLIHLDNPEKEQFVDGINAIDVVNAFPLDLSRELTFNDKLQIQMEIEEFAEDFNIFEYASMGKYLRKHGLFEHYMYFTTHTHHFGKYLDSLRYSQEQNEEVDLDA